MSVEIRLEQSKFKDKKGSGKWYARRRGLGMSEIHDRCEIVI